MRADFVLFAEAVTSLEGKLYIHGGGLTRINVPRFPWVHPQISLAIRLLSEPGDAETDHTVSLRLEGPDGIVILPEAAMHVPAQEPPPKVEGEPTYLQLSVTVGPVPLAQPGIYQFTILADSEVVAKLPLAVVQAELAEGESLVAPSTQE